MFDRKVKQKAWWLLKSDQSLKTKNEYYTQFFPISNASISNSTQNLGIFKEWVLKTFQLRNKKSVPIKIKECQYSQKNS